MRIGLNIIRITADAERDWQRRLQKPQPDFEARAVERAVKAGDAAVKSDKHISKKRARGRVRQSPPGRESNTDLQTGAHTPCQHSQHRR